jgi:hypothetical protein
MELMRQILFGIARQQANTLNLDMSCTCGYNCEDKPGIPAGGLSWGFLSPSKVMEVTFHTLTNMGDSAVCKIVKVNRKPASRLLQRSQFMCSCKTHFIP